MTSPRSEDAADDTSNSREALDALLDDMIEHPEHRTAITEEIERRFGQQQATLILDMTGFTRTTRTHGIVQFLLMIHQMHRMCCPSIGEHGGKLVKTEADNLFCLFPDVPSALVAAHDIIGRLQTANLVLPEDRRLYASIGIGYGYILNIADEDLFGDEVNLACKLSEDIGERNAILFTERAREQLSDEQADTDIREVSISGISLVYHELRHVPRTGTE
ncbi:MAG TPA: adenylate/guanylate cyclase domain-containing protein [Xanthomonadaceae bacterium]|jgi:class 3 adenylate cyclase